MVRRGGEKVTERESKPIDLMPFPKYYSVTRTDSERRRISALQPEVDKPMLLQKRAFTLIELLIVVAIIGILAAIAVPNFMNARTRAKVASVRAELRALSAALESYRLDNNQYPWPRINNRFDTANHIANVIELTTPISYISTVDMDDPFVPEKFWVSYQTSGSHPTYVYVNYHGDWGNAYCKNDLDRIPEGYGMTSHGPDEKDSGGVWWPLLVHLQGKTVTEANNCIYDPSNGLNSHGDIVRYGGAIQASPMGGGG